MFIKLHQKRISEGEIIPRWYGLAYREDFDSYSVFYPIPINIIIRICREIYYWIVYGIFKSKWERKLRTAYMEGYKKGRGL